MQKSCNNHPLIVIEFWEEWISQGSLQVSMIGLSDYQKNQNSYSKNKTV